MPCIPTCSAALISYTESGTTAKMCYQVKLTNQTQCNQANNFPANKTRCWCVGAGIWGEGAVGALCR